MTKDNISEAFLLAVEKGDTDLARALLERGADINTLNKGGWFALHNAASRGHTETVALLLDWGADINATAGEGQGKSALWQTAENDRLDCARLLLDRGADINSKSSFGVTPLATAISEMVSPRVACLLIQRGADVRDPGLLREAERCRRYEEAAYQEGADKVVELLKKARVSAGLL